jgi:hypothetical protein
MPDHNFARCLSGGTIHAKSTGMTTRITKCTFATVAAAVAAVAIAGSAIPAAYAEAPEISARRSIERKAFSDSEIIEGFFRTAFGAELAVGAEPNRIRKFGTGVRVFIDSRARPDRSAEVRQVVETIGDSIQHLDITITDDRSAANMVVTLVNDRDLPRTIRRFFGRAQAREIESTLTPQCLSSFRKDEAYRIVQADVFLVADVTDFVFYDCVFEEMLQALGPINDTDEVPWTMFNDQVRMGFFDVYDQYLLNILYHPRIQPGMDIDQVRALFPEVLADVKAYIARNNNLAP